MVVKAKKSSLYKTPPRGVNAGVVSVANGVRYRSKYEQMIHLENPYLVYEPTTYNLKLLQLDRIPLSLAKVSKDGMSITIPTELFTGGCRSRTDPYYVQSRNYTPDWVIPAEVSSTGKVIVIESKGLLSLDDCHKIFAFVKSYPQVDYRMLFQRRARVGGFKRTEFNTEWASSMGIPNAVGTKIPSNWIK